MINTQNKTTYYLIKTPKHHFYLTINTCYRNEKPFKYTMSLESKINGCVNIKIFDENIEIDDRFHNIFDPDVAKISVLQYNKDCSFDKVLDMDSCMISVVFQLVKKIFKHVKTFEMDDESYFDYDDTNISLPHFNIGLYGKTWYERHFNVVLENAELRNEYQTFIKCFTEEETKNKLSFQSIKHAFLFHNSWKHHMEKIYKSTRTLSEFFHTLRKTYKKDFCEMTRSWLENFVNSFLPSKRRFDYYIWRIDSDKIPMDTKIIDIIHQETIPKFNVKVGGSRNRHLIFATYQDTLDEEEIVYIIPNLREQNYQKQSLPIEIS